ncbi:MAG: hypoxanthine phosphoribosyltransferase, partial [Chloroflexi bacterium]|nr:hypoxanthine phosphoribosyltransferase [Chloroflexota bacterium]
MADLAQDIAKILITREALQQRIAALGEQISRDYQDQDLLLVCVLKGGVIF